MPDLAKVPFWSAIITQQAGSVSIAAGSTVAVNIQPPSGETWLVDILFSVTATGTVASSMSGYIQYSDFDGTTVRGHGLRANYATATYNPYQKPDPISVTRVLTNKLYARLTAYMPWSDTLIYGYSGFKLSQPHYSLTRLENGKPFKLSTDLPLPDPIKPLDKYKCLILGINPDKPDDYDLAIVLEEDTPLAIDPITGFPVERFSAYVSATFLADLILKFKRGELDPVKTGYKKYLDKWEAEGIRLL